MFLCVRAEIALTDGRLMTITQELNDTAQKDGELQWNLTQSEQELRDMNATLAQLRRQLENFVSAGFEGNSHSPLHSSHSQLAQNIMAPFYKTALSLC